GPIASAPRRGEGPGVPARLARPPRPVLPPRRRVGETVGVEGQAELVWRNGRKGVAAEEGCDDRRRREAAREQILEVAVTGRASEQQEPELEVHPRLVRGDERRRPVGIARLVAEFVRQPLDPVGRSLEHHPPPEERDLPEEMAGVHRSVGVEHLAGGRERAVERAQRGHRGEKRNQGEWDEEGDRRGEERRTQGAARTGPRCAKPPPDGGGEPPELSVVEEEERERDRQVVEEA